MNCAGTDSSIYDLTTYLFKFYKYLLLLLLLMLLLLLLLLMGAFHSTKIPLWNFGNYLNKNWTRLSPLYLVAGIKLHSNDRWIFDCNFLVCDQMENISMDEVSTKAFFKCKKTDPAEISKRTRVCFASNNADWNQQQLTDVRILANRNSSNHPYCFLCNQKKVQILAFLYVIRQRNVSCPLPVRDIKG